MAGGLDRTERLHWEALNQWLVRGALTEERGYYGRL